MIKFSGVTVRAGFLLLVLIIAGLELVQVTATAQTTANLQVGAIKVIGNKSLSTEYILARLQTRVGDRYDRKSFAKDLNNLVAAGGFTQLKMQEMRTPQGKVKINLLITESSPALNIPRKLDASTLLHAPAVSHWDTKNALVLPILGEPEKGQSPAVWLSLNGQKPRLFLVDTGCSLPLVIDRVAAKELSLTETGERVAFSGKMVSVTNLSRLAFSLPGTSGVAEREVPIPITQAAIGDIALSLIGGYPAPIAGILGNSLLQHLYDAAQFDFVAHTLTLFPTPNAPLRVAGAATIHIEPNFTCYVVPVTTASQKSHNFIIDTGSGGSLILSSTILHDFDPLDSHGKAEQLGFWGGKKAALTYLVSRIRIGSLEEPNVFLTATQAREELATLGVRLLSRFRMTLDYYHQEMTLERAADYSKRVLPPGKAEE